jgi:hypothetical protein
VPFFSCPRTTRIPMLLLILFPFMVLLLGPALLQIAKLLF